MNKSEPYYAARLDFPASNSEKARLGEDAFAEALSDYPVFMNVTYGKRQNDIDHLVLTFDSVIMNECKNTKEGFFMCYSWFTSHVIDRFADGLPIAQFYARSLGYPIKNIVFTLTIPSLNTEPRVNKSLKGLRINVIQTEKQLLEDEDKKKWYGVVRRQILSVFNNQTSSIACFSINKNNPQENTTSRKEEGCPESHNCLSTDHPLLESEDDEQSCSISPNGPNTLTTLTDFIPFNEHKNKKTRRNKEEIRKHNKCKSKILVICGHQKPFFACYSKLCERVKDKVARMYCGKYPNCSSCENDSFEIAEQTGVLYPTCIYEDMIDDEVTATIEASEKDLRRTYGISCQGLVWRKEGRIFSKCKCKAIRISDDEITEREALTEMAEYEPCTFRCYQLQQKEMCWFMERQKDKEKKAQRELARYFPRKRRSDQQTSKTVS